VLYRDGFKKRRPIVESGFFGDDLASLVKFQARTPGGPRVQPSSSAGFVH
jgi:hypothetical protein